MLRPIEKKNQDTEKSDVCKNKSLIVQKNIFENPDKLKNPHKYHRDLTVKERDAIIKESVKIVNLIRDMENGTLTKDVLKFVTKFYQLDKSYFE